MVTLSNCYDHTHTHYVVNVLATKNILSVKTGLNGTVTAASSVSRNVHTQSLHVACTERRRKMENARTLQTVGPGRWPVISWQLVECTSSKLAEGQPANRDAGKKKKKKKARTRGCNKTHTLRHPSMYPWRERTISHQTQNWHCSIECGSGKAAMMMAFPSCTNAARNWTPWTELAFLQNLSFCHWLNPATQGVHCQRLSAREESNNVPSKSLCCCGVACKPQVRS